MTERTYPADPADAALRLFLRWFGALYARSLAVRSRESTEGLLRGVAEVGKRWSLAFTVIDTLTPDTDFQFEAARSAVEQRLDAEGRSIALWVPRGAALPGAEPGLSQLVLSLDAANRLDDGRLELRRPVNLYLRRTSTAGSVVSILGGLASQWSRFTNLVPGSFQLNAEELYRLPASTPERDDLVERIVLATQQPEADDSQELPVEDVWTANDLDEGGSCVLGTPKPETDDWSSGLRRNLRNALRDSGESKPGPVEGSALIVVGAATYAEDEKLSWALRGMDPRLYSGYAIVVVVADGLVKPLLLPPRQTMPWDAPVG
jgi:hypothetical protein